MLLLAGCASRDPAPPPAAPPPFDSGIVVARREPLPPLVAELLEPRMRRHADQLLALQAAVISVDHPRVEEAAKALLAEPRLSRPSAAAGETLNDAIPPEFFDLQDQLVSAAHALEIAARARDEARLGEAFALLTATCVACHASYLGIAPAP